MHIWLASNLSTLEKLFFDAGLVREISRAEMYDLAARNFIQRRWQSPEAVARKPRVHNPSDWDNKLYACIGGEFFLHALEGCQHVLDVGCGEGWPSLYLAHGIPRVVGVDALPEQVALARNAARLLDIENVRFEVGWANALFFGDERFDGVCFGGNVLYHRSTIEEKLYEFARVLRPAGIFAFELWPMAPDAPFSEEAMPLLNVEPVSIWYSVREGLCSRDYLIYLAPVPGWQGRLAALVQATGRLSYGDQQRACAEIVHDLAREIEKGAVQAVDKVLFGGEIRYPTPGELPRMLREAGFVDVRSRVLPDARAFAERLQQEGVLARLQNADLIPFLRALVVSTTALPGWNGAWVTCRKA